jgi:hypothetical protein
MGASVISLQLNPWTNDVGATAAGAGKKAVEIVKATLESQSTPWLGIEKDDADSTPPLALQSDGSTDLTFTIRIHNYASQRPPLHSGFCFGTAVIELLSYNPFFCGQQIRRVLLINLLVAGVGHTISVGTS